MKKVVSVVNLKGGVGKTTTAINLAACWGELGKKVLVVDMDPQGSATISLGVMNEGNELLNALQSAYDAAADGDIIQTRSIIFSDNLNADRNIAVTIEGGYDCSYSAITGSSAFNGIMTVSDGTVTIGDYIFGY